MSYNNQWLEMRRAERRANRKTQLQHNLLFLVVILISFVLIGGLMLALNALGVYAQ